MGEIEPMFNARLFTLEGFYRGFYFCSLDCIFTHACCQGRTRLASWFRGDVNRRRRFRVCIQTLTNVCTLRELDLLVSILITLPESQDSRLHTLSLALRLKGVRG